MPRLTPPGLTEDLAKLAKSNPTLHAPLAALLAFVEQPPGLAPSGFASTREYLNKMCQLGADRRRALASLARAAFAAVHVSNIETSDLYRASLETNGGRLSWTEAVENGPAHWKFYRSESDPLDYRKAAHEVASRFVEIIRNKTN